MKIKTNNGIKIETKVIDFYNRAVTKFGNGAKINAPKDLLGKKVLVLILKEG